MILLVELNCCIFFSFTLYLCLFDLAGILLDDITQKMSQYMMKTLEYLLILLLISYNMIHEWELETMNSEMRIIIVNQSIQTIPLGHLSNSVFRLFSATSF